MEVEEEPLKLLHNKNSRSRLVDCVVSIGPLTLAAAASENWGPQSLAAHRITIARVICNTDCRRHRPSVSQSATRHGDQAPSPLPSPQRDGALPTISTLLFRQLIAAITNERLLGFHLFCGQGRRVIIIMITCPTVISPPVLFCSDSLRQFQIHW